VGAGGPPRRAAGRVLQSAAVLDPDPLRRLHALAAVSALGFVARELDHTSPASSLRWAGALADVTSRGAALFIARDEPDACPRCGVAGRALAMPATVETGGVLCVGYGAHLAPLAAHRRHRCVDLALHLSSEGGAVHFAYLPPISVIDEAQVPEREADVLVLILAGLPGSALASRLQLSPQTVRSHARALLRKLGAADRRTLRAQLFGAQSSSASYTRPDRSLG
jgi:DNA-binding CsgD family transcriptional regulator